MGLISPELVPTNLSFGMAKEDYGLYVPAEKKLGALPVFR
jgi:hypothetical protein